MSNNQKLLAKTRKKIEKIIKKKGKIDDKGLFIFIREWYINPPLRGTGSVAKFAEKIIDKCPNAEWCYFERRKYNNRISIYPKRKWLNLIIKNAKRGGNYGRKSSNNPTNPTASSAISRRNS